MVSVLDQDLNALVSLDVDSIIVQLVLGLAAGVEEFAISEAVLDNFLVQV